MAQTSVAARAALPLPEKLWVRIHPYNPSQGHRKRTFLVHGFPTAFTVDAGWYELDARLAVQLKKFRNNPNDDGSKPVFQVVTKEKAVELDQRARRKAAEADAPNRIASNPLQDRLEIPKPVDFSVLARPAEPAPGAPAAPVDGIADMLQDIVDEEASFETADPDEQVFESELPPSRGDLTTEDLQPKAMPAPVPPAIPVETPTPPAAPAPPAGRLVPRATKKPAK
jgi:hypothetical protein